MRDVVLMRVVSIGLSGKVRFEQRVEGGEEVSPMDIWDNNLPDSHCKALRQVASIGGADLGER